MKSSQLRKQCRLDQNSVKIRTPEGYPWKVLGHLADDLAYCLTSEELIMVKDLIRKRDMVRLHELSEAWGPHSITSSDEGISKATFFAKYQIGALLKKYQFPSDSHSRRAAALEKFRAAEETCLSFNLDWRKVAWIEDPDMLACYTYARAFLSDLLGEVLPERDKLTEWSRHGPGSNLDTKDGRTSLYDKYGSWPYSCTSGALEYAKLSIQDDERWLGALEDSYRETNEVPRHAILDQDTFWASVLKVVPGNRIAFVPKNARTDRSIAIEPCMNLYLQLGVDGYIRRRLKRYRVDLDDQQRNQELARLGSVDWSGPDPYVTLDLAAASDTISLELCRLLLPPQWYRYLIRLRSPIGVCGDETIEYQKISSMGNGYTFALESAIFAATCFAVEKHLNGRYNCDEVAVYGDDLIVRRSSSQLVIRMLNLFGFTLNHDKSFIEGPFRESCGADWYNGTLVRPVFLSAKPSTVMEIWNDANRIQRILSLRCLSYESDVVSFISRYVPPAFECCVGPPSDQDFDSYMHVFRPQTAYRHGMWKFTRLVATPKRVNGPNFLMRKLMHSLRGSPVLSPFSSERWGGMRLSSAGSVFTITKRGSVVVGYSSSLASYWPDEYNDPAA